MDFLARQSVHMTIANYTKTWNKTWDTSPSGKAFAVLTGMSVKTMHAKSISLKNNNTKSFLDIYTNSTSIYDNLYCPIQLEIANKYIGKHVLRTCVNDIMQKKKKTDLDYINKSTISIDFELQLYLWVSEEIIWSKYRLQSTNGTRLQHSLILEHKANFFHKLLQKEQESLYEGKKCLSNSRWQTDNSCRKKELFVKKQCPCNLQLENSTKRN